MEQAYDILLAKVLQDLAKGRQLLVGQEKKQ